MVRTSPWKTKEEWIEYGIKMEYDSRNPMSLYKSDDKTEKTWYGRGYHKKWIGDFNFNRKVNNRFSKIKTKEQWIQYGIDSGYQERYPTTLARSDEPDEKSWYWKGSRNKWLSDFKFNGQDEEVIEVLGLDTKKQWINYGKENGYEKTNPRSLSKSKDKKERVWYRKGMENSWLDSFNFHRKINMQPKEIKELDDLDKWINYGKKNGYEQRKKYTIQESKLAKERSWYNLGRDNNWLDNFSFKFTRFKSPDEIKALADQDQWLEYGYSNNYHLMTKQEVKTSENLNNRSWFNKGRDNKWLKSFKFNSKTRSASKEIEELDSKDKWIEYGIYHGYENRNSKSLIKSEDKEERSWYRKGNKNKWLSSFSFNRLRGNSQDSKLESMLENYAGGNE